MLRVKRKRNTITAKLQSKTNEIVALKALNARYERGLIEALEQLWDGRRPMLAIEKALRRVP